MSVEMVAFFAAGNIAVSQPSLALLKINLELKNMWSNWSDPKRSKTRFVSVWTQLHQSESKF
uniref:Uncharacterized protein n=1 Tax=Candidozyma auris TaxID=498019 RepID=A0A0L0NTF7_CANAR